MCDTLVVVKPDCVLFAKNSDRPSGEAQVLDWQPAAVHPPGSFVTCTHVRIPQVRHTNAVLLSRPSWMWGAEMATNEHGVTVGNEAVFTRHPVPLVGLTGMDLLRLSVERADTAERAVTVILDLIAQFGQGGSADRHDQSFRYFSSFLVADRQRAFVLETAGPHHAIEEVHGVRSISNGLTIPGFADQHSDRLKTWASRCRLRRPRTEQKAQDATQPIDLTAVLRDHGSVARARGTIDYHPLLGGMSGPCMHAGGLAVDSQTTASWISKLAQTGDFHFATATAAPCTSLFKPVSVFAPLPASFLGRPQHGQADSHSLFWQHERLHRMVMQHPDRLLSLFQAERDALEADWFTSLPPSEQAFSVANQQLAKWTQAVADSLREHPVQTPQRPRLVSHFWQRRNRQVGLSFDP
jgi:dipeptidase